MINKIIKSNINLIIGDLNEVSMNIDVLQTITDEDRKSDIKERIKKDMYEIAKNILFTSGWLE